MTSKEGKGVKLTKGKHKRKPWETKGQLLIKQSHWVFIQGIMAGLSQTDAYLEGHPNCTPATAKSQGTKLMLLPVIINEIKARRELISNTSVLTRRDIAKQRRLIILDWRSDPKDQLAAMRDHEKAMGWDKHDKPTDDEDDMNALFTPDTDEMDQISSSDAASKAIPVSEVGQQDSDADQDSLLPS